MTSRTIMIECPLCKGECVLEDPWDELAFYECDLCHGSGGIEQHLEPIECDDLDTIAGDDNAR